MNDKKNLKMNDKILWLMMHLSKEELSMIEKDKTWELVNRPLNRKIIGERWVFTKKLGVHSI